ncbi:7868_t:CDS:2 [Cetraspora pellucida]|uniref:7868_t:CDS:1 n=1 Tax=Cetraspora pellucida TaxID=1433469 RepID=A0ACA9M690_9GLOM|nr:7868_t:CDS:2 [Cetraspora pellucida]
MRHNQTNLKQANITRKKKGAWNAHKKLAIVTYLEKNSMASKWSTTEQFNIIPKQYPLLEIKLKVWVRSLCSKQKIISRHMIKTKPKQFASQLCFILLYPTISTCK